MFMHTFLGEKSAIPVVFDKPLKCSMSIYSFNMNFDNMVNRYLEQHGSSVTLASADLATTNQVLWL